MRTLLALVISLSTTAYAAQLAESISNFEGMPVKTRGGTASPAQVREAIIFAGKSRKWTFLDVGAGQLVASLTVRSKHTAEVMIEYGSDSYSVVYRNSTNLKYNPSDRSIHPSYNKWVTELVDGINVTLASIEGNDAVAIPVAAPTPQPRTTPGGGSAEVAFWESVRNSKNPNELKAYLDAYPNGAFVPLARSRLEALSSRVK